MTTLTMPTSMKELLDLRTSAPEVRWSWRKIDGEDLDDAAVPDLDWLTTSGQVDGHGSVVVRSLWGNGSDRRDHVILRGGIAVAYVTEQWNRYAHNVRPRLVGATGYSVSVTWIEPGVPDHVRREQRRAARRARTEAYDLALDRVANEIAHRTMVVWSRPDSSAAIPVGAHEVTDGVNGGTIVGADGIRVSLPGALRRAGVSVAEGERPADALRRHLDVQEERTVRPRGIPKTGRAIRARWLATMAEV